MENKIIVVDQTIREGMQHKGIVFSLSQRKKILEFQEKLNIDVCQAGYAPAHETETECIKKLNLFCKTSEFNIAIAGMGRALKRDVKTLVATGINNFHLHFQIKENTQTKSVYKTLFDSVKYIRDNVENNVISIAMLDIGRTSDSLMREVIAYLNSELEIDIISLPDTSGIMPPNLMFDKIKKANEQIIKQDRKANSSKISTHCHNDMGMANANAVMGICAGAQVLEASVLGIGERNGISDLFVTAQTLKSQGFSLNVKTEDIEIFKEYYNYINLIYEAQTGQSLLNYNTPVFGDAVKSHVAGTHVLSSDASPFGMYSEEKYYINLLCGTNLVEKYLKKEHIEFNQNNVKEITQEIKTQSAQLGRRLYEKEIIEIVNMFHN